jgi:hypothetical protein
MIKLSNILSEIGDASAKPFPWQAKRTMEASLKTMETNAAQSFKMDPKGFTTGLTFVYKFQSDQTNTKYEVVIDNEVGQNILVLPGNTKSSRKKYFINSIVAFDTNAHESTDTNLNEQYRVMATVIDCIKDFINGIQSSKAFQLNQIMVYPKADTDNGDPTINSKRGRMYKMYIQKQLQNVPNANVKAVGKEAYKITFD